MAWPTSPCRPLGRARTWLSLPNLTPWFLTTPLAIVFSGLLGGAAAARQQEPRPTFPGEAEVVMVDVVVTGEDGLPVLDLRREDFAVGEDGVPQEVVAFEAVHRPAPSAAASSEGGPAPSPAVIRTSSNEDSTRPQASVFVIVFDELHLSPEEAGRAREAIRDFLVAGVAQNDHVALVGTGGDTRCTGRMPRGGPALLQALESLRGRLVGRPVRDRMTDWEAMRIARFHDPLVTDVVMRRWLETREIDQETRLPGQRPDPEEERRNLEDWRSQVQSRAANVYAQTSSLSERTYAVVERALGGLTAARGRKTLILASGGLVSDPTLGGPRRMIMAARRANVAVYFVDARGLVGAPFEMDVENPRRTFFQDLGSTMPSEIRKRSEGSDALAAETGGFSIQNNNDLAEGLSRIGREARSYYLLAYTPSDHRRDGRFREITVTVARRGVTVRARRGYFAPRGEGDVVAPALGRDEALLAALHEPLDRDEVPLRAIVDVFGESAPGRMNVRVTFEADIRGLEFKEKGGASQDTLELLLLVTRLDTGESTRLDQQLRMTLGPDTRDCYERTWFPITRTLELAPGPYTARLVARDANSGKIGSLTHDFGVPNEEGLRLSTLTLSDREDPRNGSLGLELTARRRFAPSGMLHGRLEVYGAAHDPGTGSPNVTAGFSIRRSEGSILVAVAEEPLRLDPSGTLVRNLRLPLGGARPGSYELIAVVTDRVAGRAAEAREPFVVGGEELAGMPALPCRVDAQSVSALYWAVVDLYARGDPSRALEQLERLPPAGVDRELARLRELAEEAAGCTQCPALEALTERPVTAAAMLHSDAGWRASATSKRRARELERAVELVDLSRGLPGGSDFARRWFLASTLSGHKGMDWRTADEVATEGVKRFSEDPDLLLALGTLLETMGWRVTLDSKAAESHLERSESALARAGELSPSEETTLRLAHVRWLLGRIAAARAALEQLAEETTDKRRRYLGLLFLGGVLEEEGAHVEAAEAYRRAVETRSDTQAGRVALAHCLVRLGDVAAARATIEDALALAPTRTRDPFWDYPWGRSTESDHTLAALRAEVSACCR